MGFYMTLEDADKKFQTALGKDGESICDGKYARGRELFSAIAKHSSLFVEFGDGDKRVRPNTPEEFEAARQELRQSITDKDIAILEFGLFILDEMESHPSYYLTPSY